MIREELEFRIARYADGTLPLAERPALEAEVAADVEARAALADYQALQRAVDEARLPLPPIRWDRLADRLSAAVAELAVAPKTLGDASTDSVSGQPLDEETEFDIACYADGTLSAERRDAVEQLLAIDGRARALLDEYQDLDATAKATAYSTPLPPVKWDRLARHLSGTVGKEAGVDLPEEWESQVAEYAEGTLAGSETDAVEIRLASSPAARIALSQYRNLDAALKALPDELPVPAVDWDRLAGRISAAVSREATGAPSVLRLVGAPVAPETRNAADSYRIGSWLRSPVRLAAAASVLVAAILGARLLHPKSTPKAPSIDVAQSDPIVEVASLKVEAPSGPTVEEIQIGPPKELAQGGSGEDYARDNDDSDGVVSSPPRAFVASGLRSPSDADALPAMPF